jgi:hypothetical protein
LGDPAPTRISVTRREQVHAPRLEVIASGDHVGARAKNAVVLAFERVWV